MLINKSLAGLEVASSFGMLKFNDKGESNDLNADQEKAFEKIPGFSISQDQKAKEKGDSKDEVKAKAKESEEKAEGKTEASKGKSAAAKKK